MMEIRAMPMLRKVLATVRGNLPHMVLKRCAFCSAVLPKWHFSSSTLKHQTHLVSVLSKSRYLLPRPFPACSSPSQRTMHSNLSGMDITMDNADLRSYLDDLVQKYDSMTGAGSSDQDLSPQWEKQEKLGPMEITLVQTVKKYKEAEQEIKELRLLLNGDDEEMKNLAQAEIEEVEASLQHLQDVILQCMLPADATRDREMILEVNSGAGGQEAMLFSMELFKMYSNFAASQGWSFNILNTGESDIGGVRKASASISGPGAYRLLRYEGGIHRVQRVPRTEKSGRIHTSTASVVVLPEPDEIEVNIDPKELRIDTFRSSGPGGQHVNKTESAVRITHLPTKMSAESQESRSQHKNREIAMRVLRTRMYEQMLEKQMSSQRADRKLQDGTRARSEKMRTYNFPQDRITDHRIGVSVFGIDQFMEGGELLRDLLEQVFDASCQEQILEILRNWREGKPNH